MEKPTSDEAREIIVKANQLAADAAKLPREAEREWCEKVEEALRLYQFAKWLE